MHRLKIIKFWCVAFFHIIKHTIKNQHWNIIMVDFDNGVDDSGRQMRKQLIAKRLVGGFSIYWQDLNELFGGADDGPG